MTIEDNPFLTAWIHEIAVEACSKRAYGDSTASVNAYLLEMSKQAARVNNLPDHYSVFLALREATFGHA